MMEFFGFVLATVGVYALWTKWIAARFSARPFPDTIHYATTADGWRIALSHYRARGENPRKTPVICCHGVGCNALLFDFVRVSLARWLAAAGQDVWVIDLRGHGFSETPAFQGERSYGWSCDTYLQQDMPAAITYVCAATGSDKVHWLGLSMGGNLGLAYLSATKDERIQSLITLASGLDYSESNSRYKQVIPCLRFFTWASSIPVGPIFRFLTPLVGWMPRPIEAFNYNPDNIHQDVARNFHASGVHLVSTPVFEQLSTLFDKGGMRHFGKETHYFDGLVDLQTPTLSIAGDHDMQCPPDVSEKTHMWIGSEHKKFVIFGKAHGQECHYGHIDLIAGERADKDVWPEIQNWLASFPASP